MNRTFGILVLILANTGPIAAGTDRRDIRTPRETLIIAHKGAGVVEVPVVLSIKVDEPSDLRPGVYRLRPRGGNPSSPAIAEVGRDGEKCVVTTILPALKPGDNLFDFEAIEPAPKPSVEISEAGPNLDVAIGGKPFTTHHVDLGPKPFLYPMLGPEGERYTRSYPMENVPGEDTDHPHQRSLWFTYGQVNGIDFWSEIRGHGSIRETSRKVDGSGQVRRRLMTTDDWIGPDGKKLLEDERVLTFWGPPSRRILDVDVTLKATEGDVEFGDTKEGMFGIRVPSSMDVKAGKGGAIINAEGLKDAAAWGKRSRWVTYSGPSGGRNLSIAILEHPSSFGHPTPWHVRDYGLFAANPFGKHDFGLTKVATPTKLPRGESLRFRYRVVFSPADLQGGSAELYAAYASPVDAVIARVP